MAQQPKETKGIILVDSGYPIRRLSANAVSDTAGIVMDNFNTAYALTRNILGKGDVYGWSRSGSMCFKLDYASRRNSLLDNLFMFFTSHYRLSWITILKNSMR